VKGADYILDRVRQNPLAGDTVALYEQARQFAAANASTAARENDDAARALVRLLGASGLLLYIGRPFRLANLVAVREALAFEHGLIDLAFAMQGLGTHAIFIGGTDEQRAKYVGAAQKGEKIAAFALTEPEAGSDLAAITTGAVAQDGAWKLSGRKHFISNAPIADFFTVLAKTDWKAGTKGMSLFIVERGAGVSTPKQEVVAYHPIGEVRLDGAAGMLLGATSEGYKTALAVLETFRTSVGAAALGMAERALAESIDHTQARRQFGKPLCDQPAVQARLAEMATEIEAARLLVYRSAARKDGGAERIPLESGSAKMYATEAAQRVIDSAVQLHGGKGVEKGSVPERLYREIRSLRIYEGASDILKLVIAAQMLR
jgi:acyl-CoA dehydrogenase